MPDFYQNVHWNKHYQQDRSDEGPPEPSAFARETEALLADRSRILELGCGEGRDSAFFARSGHTVVARKA